MSPQRCFKSLGRGVSQAIFAAFILTISTAGAVEEERPRLFLEQSSEGFGAEVNRNPIQLRRLFDLHRNFSSHDSDPIKTVVEPKGWLGVMMKEGGPIKPSETLKDKNIKTGIDDIPSINITRVAPDSPAEESGIFPGDKIIAVNGKILSPGNENSVLTNFIRNVVHSGAGEKLDLIILRENGLREISVTLTAKPKIKPRLKSHPDLDADHEGKNESLLYYVLQKKSLLHEYFRTREEIRERVSQVVSTAVKGKDYDPFRLQEVNYVLNRPMTLPLVAEKMVSGLHEQFQRKRQSLSGLIAQGMNGLDLEIVDQEKNTVPPRDFQEYVYGLIQKLAEAGESRHEALSNLTATEVEFLIKGTRELFSMEPLKRKHEKSDSEEKEAEEYILKFLNLTLKVKLDKLIGASLNVAKALRLAQLKGFTDVSGLEDFSGDWIADRSPELIHLSTPHGKVLIGGRGNNVYDEDAMLIIDLGGDDLYLNNAGASTGEYPFAVVIDLSGNDVYSSSGNVSQGSGLLGGGFLIDLSGNDRYLSKSFSQGSGFLGTGALVDLDGNDEYLCHARCQAAGAFGIGILADAAGADKYSAAIYSQGFGFIKGYGALIEAEGDDTYFAGGVYPSRPEPDKAYLSMSQGFGFGLRPWHSNAGASGGIGILADKEGHDTYIGDYFGQGASYWFALGILSDQSGSDKYIAGRYSQGAGIHFSAGVLSDNRGNDQYLVDFGVAQGCGHDLAVGFLLDHGGDDRYIAGTIAQGAGNGNGIGVLNDNGGDDEYYVREKGQGRGHYEEFRELGSFGFLFDTGGGIDHYSSGARNNRISYKTEWGILADTK